MIRTQQTAAPYVALSGIDPVVLGGVREITYTPGLAKELEESQQYREMQDDIASQVLRRLSSLRL